MPNHFLFFRAHSVLVWLLASGLALSARAADSGPSDTPNAPTGISRPSVEMQRAPVPFVRRVPVVSPAPTPAVKPTSGAEPTAPTARSGLDSKAALAAVEADGYKGVTILGKGSNGAWRAKGYRGTTEVELSVDAAGRVTTE